MRSGDQFRFNWSYPGFGFAFGFWAATIVGSAGRRLIGRARLLFAYVSEPRAGRLAFAGSDLEKDFLDLRGDLSALARTDLDAIDRANRGDFSRSTAEEK